jgi:DinB family protein
VLRGKIVVKTFGIIAFVLLLSAPSAIAQVATHDQPRTVSQVVDFWVTETENLLVPAADAMPEAKYSFAPSNGEFSGVRTFAEQIKHLAAANYQLAAGTLGEEPPAGTDHETAPDSVKTKAQIMEYLKGSFISLHRAAAALNETNMNDPIPSKGNRTRLLMLIDAVVHSSNHYGQMVEYLRMNNIVPPASR